MRVYERYPAAMRMLNGAGAWALLLPVRFLCSVLYGLYLSARRFAAGWRRGAPPGGAGGGGEGARIVSIGNIEVGGGGKTPCAIAIAEAIGERGGKPVILMRGYGSLVAKRRHTPYVVPAGNEVRSADDCNCFIGTDTVGGTGDPSNAVQTAGTASLIGDEAFLYAVRGIPVVIDADRVRGARVAGRVFSPSHIILDDAFQNHSLRKSLDILLLDASRPFGPGRLMPYGTLREGPEAARRADIVIFTRSAGRRVPTEAASLLGDTACFFARHVPEDLIARVNGPLPLSTVEGRRVALFSGIARPESFEAVVRELGARVEAGFRFIDHHRYRSCDIAWMLRETDEEIAFVTTEKDWAKSAHLFPDGLDVYALRIEMEIAGMDSLMKRIME